MKARTTPTCSTIKPARVFKRLRHALLGRQNTCQVVVRFRECGIDTQGLLEFGSRLIEPAPVGKKVREIAVCLGIDGAGPDCIHIMLNCRRSVAGL